MLREASQSQRGRGRPAVGGARPRQARRRNVGGEGRRQGCQGGGDRAGRHVKSTSSPRLPLLPPAVPPAAWALLVAALAAARALLLTALAPPPEQRRTSFFLLLSWPKQSSSRSPAKFAGHTPPPVDSSHPQHHNLPISIHDQALGATEHNLDGNRGSCDPHCRRSSELRPPSNSLPWGARVAAGGAGAVGRGDFAPPAATTSLSQAGPSPPRLPLPSPLVPPAARALLVTALAAARASGRRARTWA
ncbi:hypothetical protein PVAP13_2KG047364 [Panicum virgatum]|uniref:Uncharacterized protein n=1 Tax=Panicum virgatum TaxID=38727 RepID=A0A8T0VSG3_PANVG|nr:hypothetical protein PVAP13_2KG047364 [Panicum virgatum]